MMEEIIMGKDEEMKCPSCTLQMEHHYRQQGGVRTHDWFECIPCKLHVTINTVNHSTPYESPIDKFKKWRKERRK